MDLVSAFNLRFIVFELLMVTKDNKNDGLLLLVSIGYINVTVSNQQVVFFKFALVTNSN